MAIDAHAPRMVALGAVQIRQSGDAGHDAIATCDYTTMLPQSPCPRCGSPAPHRVSPGTPSHHHRVRCGQRGHWLRWLPSPRPAQEVQP